MKCATEVGAGRIAVLALTGGAGLMSIFMVAATARVGAPPNASQETPEVVTRHYDALHADLLVLTRARGQTGIAAKALADELFDHFDREQEFALPPLGPLASLATTGTVTKREQVLAQSRKLKANLERLLEDHRKIAGLARNLAAVAREEENTDGVNFAERLQTLLKLERDVFYPAAILVGEHIALRFGE